MREPTPTVVAIAVMTIDGKIARHSSQFTDWTSPEDKDILHRHLDESDVIVVGHNTFTTAETPLSKRNCIVMTRSVSTMDRRCENLLFWNPENVLASTVLDGYRNVALLGGTQAYTYFLEQDLIDEIALTIEPLIFGNGLSLFERSGDITATFKMVSVKRLNERGSLVLHYARAALL
jgi:dihydrofolate reductase